MSDFDDKWLDIDFSEQPEFVFGDNTQSLFGSPTYEQRFGVLSPSQIDEAIELAEEAGGMMDLVIDYILNQLREGSCVGNATAKAVEVKQAIQYGMDAYVRMSAISLYKQIGRSAQSGAIVRDAWEAIEKVGFLPLDTAANREKFGSHVMPATGFSTPFPNGWKETAAKFTGHEYWPINTTDGLFSAIVQGHPVVVGRQGHSIVYVRVMSKNGQRVVKYANSWGNWGDNGFGYDTESQIREASRYAFCIRSVNAPIAIAA